MSYVYWAITGQYSIINHPRTGFVNTSRFTTLSMIHMCHLLHGADVTLLHTHACMHTHTRAHTQLHAYEMLGCLYIVL